MKGLSQESRRLIDAARAGDEPSASDRRRVRTALARKIAVGAAAGVAAATASHAAAGGLAAGTGGGVGAAGVAGAATAGVGVAASAGAGGSASVAMGALGTGLGAKLLVTVALVGAVGAGTVGYTRHQAAIERATANTTVVARSGAPAARAATVSPRVAGPVATLASPALEPAYSAPQAPSLAPPLAVVPSKAPATDSLASPPPASAPKAAAASASTLDAEVALLQEVNGALHDEDGARALQLLGDHARRFPSGALVEETQAARVFALCEVGRVAEARDVAGRFLREHPRSPLAPRVSRACDAEP